jgi:SAM-dependent methyltransferase
MSTLTASPAVPAYATLAAHYDLFTAAHRHDVWLERLEALARDHGLAGRRALDVACGTGKSYQPLLERGYEVAACDISPQMLAVARRSTPPGVLLFEADMRDLPAVGPFDLITCLDDAVNYLVGDDDLARALASMAGRLAPGGVLVFDTNTLAVYRTAYTSAQVAEDEDVFLCWRGNGIDAGGDGAVRASATIEIFERAGETWRRTRSVHHQRHWTREEVLDALAGAGLRCVAVRGQRVGARLDGWVDEDLHTKVVYVARRGGA